MERLSIILPARNEADKLPMLLDDLVHRYPEAEIIVVDDGSTDGTRAVCDRYPVVCLPHPYHKGNGAAIRTGARAATGDVIVFLDADGQHDPADIAGLIEMVQDGYDMAVGARTRSDHANAGRWATNVLYNRIAGWMVGRRIDDLTSGFRAVRAAKFRRFLYLMPNGFSYPTTATMSFFRAGYSVGFVPVKTRPRLGKSHIRPIRDGVRFLMIIFRIGSLYSPLKVFAPVSALFGLLGAGYYGYTYFMHGRFTNMSVLLLVSAVMVFMLGLVSEQVSALNYRDSEKSEEGR